MKFSNFTGIVIGLILIFLSISCQQKGNERGKNGVKSSFGETTVKIVVLPLGKVNLQLTNYIVSHLKNIFGNALLLSPGPMPRQAYYQPRNRYRADSILNWLSNRAGKNEVYVAITACDISTGNPERKVNDWGVIGLGLCPGNACVSSVFRLKNKTSDNFFKVIIHEIGHTAGLPHCSNKHCYMQDAEGHDSTPQENGFCEKCTALLRAKGWKI